MRMPDIEPCPFCGAKGNSVHTWREEGRRLVVCTDCGATGPYADFPSSRDSELDAIELWNERR